LILYDFSTYLCFFCPTQRQYDQRAGADSVNSLGKSFLRNTRFTEFLIQKNGLGEGGFKGWVFCAGMLFNSTDKWWGDRGKRVKPHEGLDLCLYKDREDTILRLCNKAKVPVTYGGIVVGIIDDFLGKSVIIEHSFADRDNSRLCTIYGHTIPRDNLHVGNIIKEGDIIATLAGSSRSKSDILPHLHISLARTSRGISYDKLDWENIGDPKTLTLLDPLQIIDRQYFILARETCENL
jgi:hypothetical protein